MQQTFILMILPDLTSKLESYNKNIRNFTISNSEAQSSNAFVPFH